MSKDMARTPRQLPAPSAAGPASAPPTGEAAHRAPAVDPATALDHERYVLSLVLAGAPTIQIEQLACAPSTFDGSKRIGGGLGVSKTVARQLIRAVRSLLLEESPETVTTRRAEMTARLQNDLMRMRSLPKVPYAAVSQHEKLLSELHGLLAPRRVAIELSTVPDALAAVVAGMTDSTVEEQLLEERERDRMLRSITVSGEASPVP
jgi:hypothetical protein